MTPTVPLLHTVILLGVALLRHEARQVRSLGEVLTPAPLDASTRSSLVSDLRLKIYQGGPLDNQTQLAPWLTPITPGGKGLGVVLGQSLYPDGSIPQVIVDRAQAAKQLLEAGLIENVLVSGGDTTHAGYTEASVLAAELARLGVPPGKIIQEGQALTTGENAWFTLRWIPQGTGTIYIITSDFHMARATYIFQATFNYFYSVMEAAYSAPYPRLQLVQAPTQSFCGSDASLSQDNDPAADINFKSLAWRANHELYSLGSGEAAGALYGPPKADVMYIWPVQIDVNEDPDNAVHAASALAQATNAAAGLCACKSPPSMGGPALPYPLTFPINATMPANVTWLDVYNASC